MGLPQQPSDPSPKRGEAEPLDLRKNYSCRSKSPPFYKRRHLFHQGVLLDLRVKHEKIGPLFPLIGSDTQYSCVSNNTTTLDQQQIPFVCQYEQIFSKCHQNEDAANAEYTSESNSAMFPCHLPLDEEVEQSSVGVKVLQTEALSVKTYHESSNKTQPEYLDKTTNNIPYLFKSNKLEKSFINTDNSVMDKNNREFSTKDVHKTEKYKNESDQRKKVNERKVKSVSTISIIAVNQELAVKEYENVSNQYDNFEENVEKEGDAIENNPEIPSQNEEGDEPSPKKIRFETSVPSSPNLFKKPSVKQLKKTGESFLQDGKCYEVAPKLPRCRECSLALQESIDKTQLESDNVLCRFYAFRKLRYSSKGFLATAGFLDPHLDTTLEDLRLWQPMADVPPPDLDLKMALYVLTHVGDQFCDLCKQEEEAISVHMSEDKTVAWKKLVPGFREMCDVCSTTLFNFHWTCRTCGFAVCIDCYKARKGCMPERVTYERPWLICVNKRAHDLEKMMLTQIIAADSLKHLQEKAHEIRTSLGLPLHCCGCPSPGSSKPIDSQSDNLINEIPAKRLNLGPEVFDKEKTDREEERLKEIIPHPDPLDNATPGHIIASGNQDRIISFEDYCSDTDNYLAKFYSSLTKRLNNSYPKNSTPISVPSNRNSTEDSVLYGDTLEEVILTLFEPDAIEGSASMVAPDIRRHDHRFSNHQNRRGYPIPTRVMTLTESHLLYPDCPHSWLCEGRLLKLSDPSHVGNYSVFQDQWKRGQPVLVSSVLEFLDESLWQPGSFIRDFGDTKNDLVNCMTGRVIPGQYMRKFWEGFQNVSEMLKDDKGKPMLLKLKDWPPGEDFAEMLPTRFEDLMKALPMGEYTKRTGQLNLPSRLPSCFARPDLGPKMYIAYGSAIYPTKGTTNLHLDMSDAVNVMVYVGIPNDIDREKYMREAYRAVDEACSDVLMRCRVRQMSEVPGALWHIYSARDSDKIRDLLTRVARERRIKLGPHQDPIHDQSWYLDATLRDRLYKEYNVRGYAIVQCLGDAVFIPAGAPHQVRNLLNCIKVAEDFVSPENVSHCLHLTQEFRKLSDFHTNHEDKLQIKNIIYHAVKDSVSVLSQ